MISVLLCKCQYACLSDKKQFCFPYKYMNLKKTHTASSLHRQRADSEVYLEWERDMQLASQTDSNYNNHNNLQTAS